MRRTLVRWTLVCIGLVMVALTALWLARDLPRRILERALADRLAARVHLGELDIVSTSLVRLGDLRIQQVRDYPFIAEIRIAEIQIEGTLQEMVRSRFHSIRLRGLQADLAPAPWVEPPESPLPIIDELVLEPAIIQVTNPSEFNRDVQLTLEATLHDIGTRPLGEVHLRSKALLIGPLLALTSDGDTPPIVSQLDDFRLDLDFDHASSNILADASRATAAHREPTPTPYDLLEASELRLRVASKASTLTFELDADTLSLALTGEVATIARPRIDGSLERATNGLLHIEAVPQIAGLDSAHIFADWQPTNRRLVDLGAEVIGLDLTRLLPGSGLTGVANADLRRQEDRVEVRATISPRRLQLGPKRSLGIEPGASLRLVSGLPFEPISKLEIPDLAAPIEAYIDIPKAKGQWDAWTIPESIFPLNAEIRGMWRSGATRSGDTRSGDGSWQFEGESKLKSQSLGQLTTDGDVTIESGLTTTGLAWQWQSPDLADVAAALSSIGLPIPALEVAGNAKIHGDLKGPLSNPSVGGRFRFQELTVGTTDWHLSEGNTSAAWSWRSQQNTIQLSDLKATGSLRVAEFASIPWIVEATGWSKIDATRGEIQTLTTSSPNLGQAHGRVEWHGAPARGAINATGTMALSGLDLAHWRKVLPADIASQLPANFEIQGVASGELAGHLADDSTWMLEGPLELKSAGFTDTDGSRVLLGLGGRWQVNAEGGSASPINLTAAGSLGGFQLLWGTYYGDFSQIETSLDVRAELAVASEIGVRPWHVETRGALPDGPTIRAEFDSPTDSLGLRYTLAFEDPDLRTTHARYLSTLLADHVGQLTLAGAFSARAKGSYYRDNGPFSWSLAGDLNLTDFALRSGGGQAEVNGLRLELPFDMRRRPTIAADFSGPRLSGHLAFDQLAVRGLELPATDTDLVIEADSVGLEQALTLDILGGSLALEQLTLRELFRPQRHLETGLLMSEISLERISSTMGIFPLEGALDGHFPIARLSPDQLSVDGGGQIKIFGGTIELHNISGENILTRFPKLELSADFENIDLGRLTRRIDFGEMTGVLRGSLQDCELFRGVPVRFKAKVETVNTPGVPRTIDVKAINNLTILSTGQRTNAFDRGFQKFFKKYTYESLGVSLRLDHDVLLLRGQQHRGDKELFLSGRLPFRIDVVNAKPGKTVSFQTMMGRLRSLDFSAATSKP